MILDIERTALWAAILILEWLSRAREGVEIVLVSNVIYFAIFIFYFLFIYKVELLIDSKHIVQIDKYKKIKINLSHVTLSAQAHWSLT